MRDISGKQISLRTARAQGLVLCPEEILELVKSGSIPKGNIFEIAKAAGLLAAKNTHNLIPHCHPVTIDGLDISYKMLTPSSPDITDPDLQNKYGILIQADAKSIGRTGIEMEALMTVSIVALTIYDLLKPLGNKDIEISGIKLVDKTGGKSDRARYTKRPHQAAVLVCSDSTAAGTRKDSSGLIIQDMLQLHNTIIADYQIVPDEKEVIQQQIRAWVEQGVSFIFTTGGTGLGPRDTTVEAVSEILEREAPGITEAMRVHGGMRTPLAMLSRSVAGCIGETLVVTLPGSSNGVRESLEAILPGVFHAKAMLMGGAH
ncbi:MAG: bifunctional molybdenum cofactor biosynthesis protein MoaC/MoaB [Cytophagaceae bacterium]